MLGVLKTRWSDKSIAVGTTNEATRAKWVERTLSAIPSGSRLLDAGAGEQQYKKYCSHLEYVSQDFSMYSGTGDGRGLQTGSWDVRGVDIVSDITAIPKPQSSFDVILCTEVLEHIPDPLAALKEFGRLLRPGGLLIITAPFCSLTHFSPHHYATGFSSNYFDKHLPELGFQIVELGWNGNYFEYIAQELRRMPDVSARYTDTDVDEGQILATEVLLERLQDLSNRDHGSWELLNHGIHIKAIKGEAAIAAAPRGP
jgi:ubiquinone/menaquinone biosynthesis C-methylase UbiE